MMYTAVLDGGFKGSKQIIRENNPADPKLELDITTIVRYRDREETYTDTYLYKGTGTFLGRTGLNATVPDEALYFYYQFYKRKTTSVGDLKDRLGWRIR